MFQILKYRIITLCRSKDLFFWTLLFPILLGTFFQIAFGDYMKKNEAVTTISVAVVQTKENDRTRAFNEMLEELTKEEAYLSVSKVSLEKAEEMLESKEVTAIIRVEEEISLVVKNEGVNQSILKSILNQYLRSEAAILRIIETAPEHLETALKSVTAGLTANEEVSLSNSKYDTMTQYFYALIAMACLYGATFGLRSATDLQANLSPLGARRSVAPTEKLKVILGDFLGSVVILLTELLIVFAYLVIVLGVDFGNNLGYVLLTALAGSLVAVSLGTFIGLSAKGTFKLKDAITNAIVLILSFLSGLMISHMKYIVETYAPVINRINPAALIADALYCLDIYSDHTRYYRNIISLFVIAALLCTANIWRMRRECYDSI